MSPSLRRTISLPLLTLYGLGTILGAGIYVLVGKVAGVAGLHAPLAFGLAALLATFTAFSYAELATRFPRSAGEALYVQEGLGRRWLSTAVGWMVVLSGVVSAATLANGFAGYLRVFLEPSAPVVIACMVLALGALAAWGIRQSVFVAVVITLLEIAGLVLVIVVAGKSLRTLPERAHEVLGALSPRAWSGIGQGAFLAFYAFIGFEDIVNMAEEVKDARRSLPRAILWSLAIATLLYVVVALIAVLGLPLDVLAESDAPLADLVAQEIPPEILALIGLVAILNGALVQIVMASRVVYGMGCQGMAPKALAAVNRRTQTPFPATLFVTALTLILALSLPLVSLARATSSVILITFALVNLSLLSLKRKQAAGVHGFTARPWVPALGCVLSVGLLLAQAFSAL